MCYFLRLWHVDCVVSKCQFTLQMELAILEVSAEVCNICDSHLHTLLKIWVAVLIVCRVQH